MNVFRGAYKKIGIPARTGLTSVVTRLSTEEQRSRTDASVSWLAIKFEAMGVKVRNEIPCTCTYTHVSGYHYNVFSISLKLIPLAYKAIHLSSNPVRVVWPFSIIIGSNVASLSLGV